MARCFVIGLGNIGGAVATRLATTGADVIGVDPDLDARRHFAAHTGGVAISDWREQPPDTDDRVIVLVRTVEQATDLLDSLSHRGVELTVFVMTTLDLAGARALAHRDDRPLRVVEMPVSGGRGGALAGTLTAMVAGPITDDDRAFLQAHVVRRLVEFEHYGEPTAAKLYNNALAAYHACAHAEILLSAADQGIDVGRLTAVLDHSSGASWMGSNLAVIVDDLLEKDVALFESSFGSLPAIEVGDGSKLGERLAAARLQLNLHSTRGDHDR